MNITAMLKRAFLVAGTATLAVSMLACAGSRVPDAMEPQEARPEVAPASTAAAVDQPAAPSIVIQSRDVLASSERQSVGLEHVVGSDFEQVVIRTNQESPDYRVIRLNSPNRLVVDVLSAQSRINRIFDLDSKQYLRGIRIGAHPDKSRIVLDLPTDSTLVHNVDTSTGNIIVTLAPEQSMDLVLAALSQGDVAESGLEPAPLVEPAVAVAEAPLPEVAEPLELAAAELPAPEAVLAAQEVAANEQAAPAVMDARPKLVRLEMNRVSGEGNQLVAHMESAGYFSLKQTAPSEYVLRLEDATFSSEEVQPIIAPRDAGSIRTARAVREGHDTLVRIFAQPGSSLRAEAKRGMIVVKDASSATADYAALPDEARAQLTPEEEAAEPAAEPAPEAPLADDQGFGVLLDETPRYTGRLISLDLQDTDIDNALRIIAEVSNLNIIASDDVTGKVTLRLIDVPWDQALDVILKTNGLDKVQEGSVVRIAPVEKLRREREALKQAQEAEEDLEPLTVKYIRISYARASDLTELVETVVSERGTVAYDERTNQLIVKDIRRGIRNVAQLVQKLDLRTPQVLLETQIVEAQRQLLRELGSEVQFDFLQGPTTGNATGHNFPNAITTQAGSIFAAPSASASEGAAIAMLLDSADGSLGLDVTLSALEREGRVRIVSRPAVATTNNQPATIKSVEKLRVKTPDGGTSVATGAGATAAGSGIATETIEIGIVLEVTPQASPDYYVLLDVNAKSSTLGSTLVDGIPSEIERSATSTVLVSSGQTFALGGIYKITDQNRLNGIPFLKDIPVLGHFFRVSQVDNSDEELIFFITPRIIEGSFDDAAMRVAS